MPENHRLNVRIKRAMRLRDIVTEAKDISMAVAG